MPRRLLVPDPGVALSRREVWTPDVKPPRSSLHQLRRHGLWIAGALSWALPGSAAEPPPHLGRYLEGLEALGSGSWSGAVAIFDEIAGPAGRDPRPMLARGVALTMQGRVDEAAHAFQQATALGHKGREPALWTHVIGRMANRAFGPGQGVRGPRSLGGGAVFSGVPGHMIQGGDDYPTNYASFLYYDMATPIGQALENGRPTDTPAIRANLLEGARWFANRARTAPDLAAPLYQRARALNEAARFAEALALLAIVRVPFPEDGPTAALAADCWLGLGRPATARREATLALTGEPESAHALLRRAVAAGRLGRTDQARADLGLAAALDGAAVKPVHAVVEQAIAEGDRAGDPVARRRELVQRVGRGAGEPAIDEAARSLARAAERTRRYYDEHYAEEIRRRTERSRQRPKDPTPLAGLAAFLLDEARADRRGEAVETGRANVPYRSASDDTRDVRRALALADQALAIDGRHVGALMQRARALSRLGDHAGAERVVAHALGIAPDDPQARRQQGAFWIERANRLFGEAAMRRAPRVSTNTWRENRSDGVWEVTRTTTTPPSQADLNAAAQLDAEADRLLQQARSAIAGALEATRGTLEGDLLAADVALTERRWADAEKAARAALKRDPRSLAAHDIIVDARERSGQRDRADHARSERANLVQTTAGWKLTLAWRAIEQRAFDAATRLLAEAEAIDPADGRIDAFRGEVARLTNRHEDARAAWRVALALAQARVALDERAVGAAGAQVPRDPLESGLALAMRERLAAASPPAEALELYRASMVVGDRLPPGGAATEMFTAMLPDPETPQSPMRRPRNTADWLVLARVGAARLFTAAGKDNEAMAEYRAAGAYAALGGAAMTPNIADPRGNRQNSNFAVYATVPELGEALIVLGRDAVRRRDFESAQTYLHQAVATPISRAQRQEVNELQLQLARLHRNR